MFHSADTRLVLQSEPGEPTPHRERWVVDSDATHGKNESVSSWWIVVTQYPHLATMDEKLKTHNRPTVFAEAYFSSAPQCYQRISFTVAVLSVSVGLRPIILNPQPFLRFIM